MVISYSRESLQDLRRIANFLGQSEPHQTGRVLALVRKAVLVLEDHPLIGRPVGRGLRELVIARGRAGYVALYAFDVGTDEIAILGIRHQREVGYGNR